MADQPSQELPLRRFRRDPLLRAKVAALWHRERMRETYVRAGYTAAAARVRANREAHDVALRMGWKGDLGRLKHELADLLDPKPSPVERRIFGSERYWEDDVRERLKRLLALTPNALAGGIHELIARDAEIGGPFRGQEGMYKLAYLIGFIPPLDNLARRNAFIRGLSAACRHPDRCDPEMFAVVFRLLRPYTLKPFEARVGFSMPPPAPAEGRDPKQDALPTRRRFARLRNRLSRRRRKPYGM